jgi:hypothetical protein
MNIQIDIDLIKEALAAIAKPPFMKRTSSTVGGYLDKAYLYQIRIQAWKSKLEIFVQSDDASGKVVLFPKPGLLKINEAGVIVVPQSVKTLLNRLESSKLGAGKSGDRNTLEIGTESPEAESATFSSRASRYDIANHPEMAGLFARDVKGFAEEYPVNPAALSAALGAASGSIDMGAEAELKSYACLRLDDGGDAGPSFAVGTNGHQLSRHALPSRVPTVSLPSKITPELISILRPYIQRQAEILLLVKKNPLGEVDLTCFEFPFVHDDKEFGKLTFYAQPLGKDYPNHKALIEGALKGILSKARKTKEGPEIRVSRTALLKALDRLTPISDMKNKLVILGVDESKAGSHRLHICTQPLDMAEASEYVAATINDDALPILRDSVVGKGKAGVLLNSDYLKSSVTHSFPLPVTDDPEILSKARGNDSMVCIRLQGPKAALIVSPIVPTLNEDSDKEAVDWLVPETMLMPVSPKTA